MARATDEKRRAGAACHRFGLARGPISRRPRASSALWPHPRGASEFRRPIMSCCAYDWNVPRLGSIPSARPPSGAGSARRLTGARVPRKCPGSLDHPLATLGRTLCHPTSERASERPAGGRAGGRAGQLAHLVITRSRNTTPPGQVRIGSELLHPPVREASRLERSSFAQ